MPPAHLPQGVTRITIDIHIIGGVLPLDRPADVPPRLLLKTNPGLVSPSDAHTPLFADRQTAKTRVSSPFCVIACESDLACEVQGGQWRLVVLVVESVVN